MLEKIGLPAKPSLRGNNWVIDASHCQGCSSQFNFFNRKHHCRRCGGIFCNTCTQQRMILRGQGDSPVRVCDPCKKLEDAARFELRHGHRSKTGKGGSKLAPKNEDEVLNQILGTHMDTNLQRDVSSSSSIHEEALTEDQEEDGFRSFSVDLTNEIGASSPEELRQQALEEKKKYKILKVEGKPEEALQAFKRGKELERRAGALEIALRKSRRKASALTSSSLAGSHQKDIDPVELGQRNKFYPQKGKEEKDDLAAELRELGWSDADLADTDKMPRKITLEGELSNLVGDVPQKSIGKKTGGIDKTQVLAHKKKAVMFKKEGKLAEAKEELKRAKVLEKQIEEQEFLAEAEESDDELSDLIRTIDEDKSTNGDSSMDYRQDPGLDINHLLGAASDFALEDNFEVTDDDMNDPEIVSALTSFGWQEVSDHSTDRETLQSEVLSLKREALKLKRAGNSEEAMAQLKRAKLLEKDLEKLQSQSQSTDIEKSLGPQTEEKYSPLDSEDLPKPLPKTKLAIKKELLGLKKKALALKREGCLDEAEDELKKGKMLERQLEEMENPPKMEASRKKVKSKQDVPEIFDTIGDGEEADVTEQDMQDPALLSILQNLGWKEEDVESANLPNESIFHTENWSSQISPGMPTRKRRSKAEIQKELLGIKRKALALRRQGKHEEAEEELRMAKILEAEMAEMEVADGSKFKEPSSLGQSCNQEDMGIEISDVNVKVPELKKPFKGLDLMMEGANIEHYVGSTNTSQSREDRYQSIAKTDMPGDLKLAKNVNVLPQVAQSVNLMDLLTGTDGEISRVPIVKPESEGSSDINILPLANTHMKPDMLADSKQKVANPVENLSGGVLDHLAVKRDQIIPPMGKIQILEETNSGKDQSSLRQETLDHKKKAVALKREGKLAEAREELIRSKILEKSLEADDGHVNSVSNKRESAASNTSVLENETNVVASKHMSGRDRFKLQQECLAHKRQALKLRREGKIQESEAESELAKAIESQLEESATNESTTDKVESVVDDVESLLDPQLLSALKAIGWQDADLVGQASQSSEISPEDGRGENTRERTRLEEQIKAEKLQAVKLKKAGKQSEALDALRRAKQLEKKLNTLASS